MLGGGGGPVVGARIWLCPTGARVANAAGMFAILGCGELFGMRAWA